MLINLIASDEVLDAAYEWLWVKRAHYHFNGDIWHVRRWWHEIKPQIQQQLLEGRYFFRELRVIQGKERRVEWWCSIDALVLKATAIVLGEHLKPHLSQRCFHLAGTGGMKAAVREVAANLSEYQFVFRTDVKGYYASINHHILMEIVGQYVEDDAVKALLWGYLRRYVSDGGHYLDITQGISLGCPLSPLMGALYLKPLDDRMAELGCFYVRYVDDWVLLTPTRWKLRKAIKAVNEVMADLLVVKHPDKTYIGRIARGFEFLGYRFDSTGVGVAQKTVDRMKAKVTQLYERGASVGRIGDYLRRWVGWVKGGLWGCCWEALLVWVVCCSDNNTLNPIY